MVGTFSKNNINGCGSKVGLNLVRLRKLTFELEAYDLCPRLELVDDLELSLAIFERDLNTLKLMAQGCGKKAIAELIECFSFDGELPDILPRNAWYHYRFQRISVRKKRLEELAMKRVRELKEIYPE